VGNTPKSIRRVEFHLQATLVPNDSFVTTYPFFHMRFLNLFHFLMIATVVVAASTRSSFAQDDRPHAVFVIGTEHYSPQRTMPGLAEQLEAKFGFKTTLIMSHEDPEKNEKGLPGLEILENADIAIFFMRFLTLPEDQLGYIERYLKSGKPVVGFRTSTHAFAYPSGHSLEKWNDGFGRDALGSKYFIHLQGPTEVERPKGAKHPVLRNVNFKTPQTAGGTLYLAELPDDAVVLLEGTGKSKKVGEVSNAFGTHQLTETMTQPAVWTWKNQWGGRVFTSMLGHVKTFENPDFVRLFINGIHWAAGRSIPKAEVAIHPVMGHDMHAVMAQAKKAANDKVKSEKAAVAAKKTSNKKVKDAKSIQTGNKEPEKDPALQQYAIFGDNARRAKATTPVATSLPLKLKNGDRIALIGNTLFDRDRQLGYFESLIHQTNPNAQASVRTLAWAADEVDLQPRPDNFGDIDQHLTTQKADVIFAAFGFNESFAGVEAIPDFKKRLQKFLRHTKSQAYNGESGPRLVLVSPVANENVEGVKAADLNNPQLAAYTKAMKEVADAENVGFVDVFESTQYAMSDPKTDLTFNGAHMLDEGYRVFGKTLLEKAFGEELAPEVNERIRATVVEKNEQFFYRYRPLNSFYYTGGRNKSYGYLDFLPAMRNFDIMVANRDQRIWDLAVGKNVPEAIDDSNVPELPKTHEARGANIYLSPKDELDAFQIDPRFDVNLFASEEEFPDIACPIQMRWDAEGRLWVSCSTTYPHVYPGQAPSDKLVILEDTDGDGKADKSTVFADDLHIPLSFVLGNGGVYVSEEPDLVFIKDTDGDGKADFRRKIFTGFGTEDSHHALHDFTWTPDGDLLFRESIFHNSQVETVYGPIRAKNSAWFRYRPSTHRLTTFGAYPNTNPWGVTYDDWGNHVASHPIFATAFHATNPPYPEQHPKATGMQAYSGTCGQEFVDFDFWPEELQGGFIKARYKPNNRIEIHKWIEREDSFVEEYQSDLIFSTNLSFIPVDIRFGPRGALYVCDWYNPIKGHAQYSLRDERRDRKSGRIWRIVPKGATLQDPPKIAGASIPKLLDILKRPEYRYRYWAKRELRDRNFASVEKALDRWVSKLDVSDPRHRHHQLEAIWLYRGIDAVNTGLLKELLESDNHLARAAGTRQLRYWSDHFEDGADMLLECAGDDSALVRMEAAIAASYVGTSEALDAAIEATKHPAETHLKYAIATSLGSEKLSRHWKGNEAQYPEVGPFLEAFTKGSSLKAGASVGNANEASFDSQKGLVKVDISCVPERMLFTVTEFTVKAGKPVRLTLENPTATPHNLVIVEPGTAADVGMAGNLMAASPDGLGKHFVPDMAQVLFHTKLLDPDTSETLRFIAPTKPGEYPYICSFPGHWIIMRGVMTVER
jgi:azurin